MRMLQNSWAQRLTGVNNNMYVQACVKWDPRLGRSFGAGPRSLLRLDEMLATPLMLRSATQPMLPLALIVSACLASVVAWYDLV